MIDWLADWLLDFIQLVSLFDVMWLFVATNITRHSSFFFSYKLTFIRLDYWIVLYCIAFYCIGLHWIFQNYKAMGRKHPHTHTHMTWWWMAVALHETMESDYLLVTAILYSTGQTHSYLSVNSSVAIYSFYESRSNMLCFVFSSWFNFLWFSSFWFYGFSAIVL